MQKIRSAIFAGIVVVALASLSSLLKPGSVYADSCSAGGPNAPSKVWTTSGPNAGEVTLYWDESAYADRYAVAYGSQSGKYIYGADNIGNSNSRSYTVKWLTPGQKYYFRLAAAKGCSSSPLSSEVSAVAKWGQVAQTSQMADKIGSPQKTWAGSDAGPVGKQKLWAKPGPMVGEVTLNWQNADSADNYHIVYGHWAGKYEYGALNVGKNTWYTVKKLQPGKAYYFAVVPVMNNRALYTSDAVIGKAKAAIQVVVTSPESMGVPKTGGITEEITPSSTLVEEPTPTSVVETNDATDDYDPNWTPSDGSSVQGTQTKRIGNPADDEDYNDYNPNWVPEQPANPEDY